MGRNSIFTIVSLILPSLALVSVPCAGAAEPPPQEARFVPTESFIPTERFISAARQQGEASRLLGAAVAGTALERCGEAPASGGEADHPIEGGSSLDLLLSDDGSSGQGGPGKRGWPATIGENFSTPLFYDLDGDGRMEIIATDRSRTYIYDAQGTLLPGWPQNSGESNNNPAVADLDEDGAPEIIVATVPPRLKVYHLDGTLLAGFPVTLPWRNWLNASCPVAADVDGDGHLDVGAQSELGVAFFDRFGQPLPGWPYQWYTTQNIVWSAPAVADLDGDGSMEVVVGNNNFGSCGVHVIGADGTARPGWPRSTESIFSSAALADLDGDGDLEIIVQEGEHTWYGNRMHVWHHTGAYLAGWPRVIAPQYESSRSNPAVGDLDGDGTLEIVTATADSKLHVFRPDGTEYIGYPRTLNAYAPISSVQLIDVDADGVEEIFLCYYLSGDHVVGAWRLNGTMLPGFPKLVFSGSELSAHSSTHVADLEGDGDLDLCVQGGTFGTGLVWVHEIDGSVYNPGSSRADWPKIRHDAANRGCYTPQSPTAAPPPRTSLSAARLVVYPNPAPAGSQRRIAWTQGGPGNRGVPSAEPCFVKGTVQLVEPSGRIRRSISWNHGDVLTLPGAEGGTASCGVLWLRLVRPDGTAAGTTRIVTTP